MSEIRFTCPNCRLSTAADAGPSGAKVRCPRCQTMISSVIFDALPADASESDPPRRERPRPRKKKRLFGLLELLTALMMCGYVTVFVLVSRGVIRMPLGDPPADTLADDDSSIGFGGEAAREPAPEERIELPAVTEEETKRSAEEGEKRRLAFRQSELALLDKLAQSPPAAQSEGLEWAILADEQDRSNSSHLGAALSPDGRLLAETRGALVKMWSLRTGELLHTLAGHTSRVRCLAFSPTGGPSPRRERTRPFVCGM
jgi:predicted Zn finger-like uncharacterized protein